MSSTLSCYLEVSGVSRGWHALSHDDLLAMLSSVYTLHAAWQTAMALVTSRGNEECKPGDQLHIVMVS